MNATEPKEEAGLMIATPPKADIDVWSAPPAEPIATIPNAYFPAGLVVHPEGVAVRLVTFAKVGYIARETATMKANPRN